MGMLSGRLMSPTQTLIKTLHALGIRVKLHTEARTKSRYYTFPDCPGLGKLRVSNHEERSRYAYRWQLRLDSTGYRCLAKKGHRQFIYGPDQIGKMAQHIHNYREFIWRAEREADPLGQSHWPLMRRTE
jgi:hypothetical protein